MRPRMASISVGDTRPAATRDSVLSITARPACGSAASRTERMQRQRAAAIDDGANQVHDAVDEAPGEIAAERGDEHLAQLLAPGLRHRHGAGEAEGHEQAEQHLHDPVHRMEDRLARGFGRGRARPAPAAHRAFSLALLMSALVAVDAFGSARRDCLRDRFKVWRAIISSSLVGITQTDDLAVGGADARPAGLVGGRIELDAEPGRVATQALADRRRVLADAGGEDERVQAAGGGGERAELAAEAIAEQLDGEARARVVAREQHPHVARQAGDAEQPRLLVDQRPRWRARPCRARPSGRGPRRDRDCRSACPSAGRRRR